MPNTELTQALEKIVAAQQAVAEAKGVLNQVAQDPTARDSLLWLTEAEPRVEFARVQVASRLGR